eukprot:2466953-Prymnesium_polylepis.1
MTRRLFVTYTSLLPIFHRSKTFAKKATTRSRTRTTHYCPSTAGGGGIFVKRSRPCGVMLERAERAQSIWSHAARACGAKSSACEVARNLEPKARHKRSAHRTTAAIADRK